MPDGRDRCSGDSILGKGASRRVLVGVVVSVAIVLGVAGCDGKPGHGSGEPNPPSSAGASPSDDSADPSRTERWTAARHEFTQRIAREARENESPWAIAHALLALGDTLEWEGKRAVPRLRERWLRVKGDGEARRVGFRLVRAETLGEQHPHLVLKNLAERGMGSDLVEELVGSAARDFRAPSTWQDWNDVAWLVEGLAWRNAPPPPLGEQRIDVRELAVGMLERLEAADERIEAELAKGPRRFERPSGEGDLEAAGTYAYTCGGLHVLQALLKSAERGWLDDRERERLAARVVTFARRLEAECAFRDREFQRAVAAGAEPTVARRMRSMFLLKLVGHGLEIAARTRSAGLEFGPREKRRVDDAFAEARQRVEDGLIEFCTGFDPSDTLLPSLRGRGHPFWELWFGDGCHALRGLELTDE